jgi:hypothetical protein
MAQVETIGDVIDKTGSIEYFWKLVDPENRYSYSTAIKEWYRLSHKEQQKLYLYILYRKWRGIPIYGTPYDIITYCHPAPFNWNQHSLGQTLIAERKAIIAKYQGSYGTYTRDEARLYDMTDKQWFKCQIQNH